MDKPRPLPAKAKPARPLAELLRTTIKDAFAKQGFAATELVTRWPAIVGDEIAVHCEPERIIWPRPIGDDEPEPGTLVLRVEGPAAIEIQHLKRPILERVNIFFGWQAVADLRLRQAPLSRRPQPTRPKLDQAAADRIAASLTAIGDDKLRQALARLGAAAKRD